ncbi:MAG TPA: DUF998 domain-containing protein [Vicinamibacterales bacterium]|nr:DUF998 domain-containing protein [Vicinamibacterales bacterium]
MHAHAVLVCAAAAFAAIVATLHVMRRDVSPRARGISRYANGRTLVAMTLAFLALATATAAAAWITASSVLLVAAVSLATIAAAPEPASPAARARGIIHTAAGFVFFVSMAIGAVTVSGRGFAIQPTVAWLLAVVTMLFFAGLGGAPGLKEVRGLLQRACFALTVAWLVLIR